MTLPRLRRFTLALMLPLTIGLVGCASPSPASQGTGGGNAVSQQPAAPKKVTAAMMGTPVCPIDRFIGGRSGGGVPGAAEFAKTVGSGLTVGRDLDAEFIPQ